jgi:RNA polymerase sigma-70 factor (ECF subfamily)
MQEKYNGLCTLVSKEGICHQCAGLSMLAPEEKRGGPFPDVAEMADRIAVVRAAKPGSMSGLHDVFWRRTKECEQKGLGSTTSHSDCGVDDGV